MTRFLIMFLIIFVIVSLGKAQEEWKLIKNSDNVKIYIKEKNENSEYINIKAVTYATGKVSSFAEVMKDVSNYKKWMHSVEKTYVVSRENTFHFNYYILTDIPWPARDRDAIINLQINWNPEKKMLTTKSKEVENVIPEKENIHRVEDLKASYSFVQMDDDKVKIRYTGKIKPQVELPDWLRKKIYYIAPYNTLKNLRKFAGRSKYKDTCLNLDNLN